MAKQTPNTATSSRKSPHVLFLLENCTYPEDDRVRRETRTLVAAGYRVSVICPAGSGQNLFERVNDVCVYRYPETPAARGFLGYLWEYGYSLSAIFLISLAVWVTQGFDILHAAHPPDMFAFLGAFYKIMGKRYVMDHHDIAPELYRARFHQRGNPVVFAALSWMEKFSCRVADAVITTNRSYKALVMQRDGVTGERVTIVRNGPDLQELRRETGEPGLSFDGKTVIGYVGVIGFQDGVDYFLRAVRNLVFDLNRTNIVCVLVGDGSALAGLRVLARELGIEAYCLFTGWVHEQSEVARYIDAMDLCVAPEPSDPYNDRSTAAKVMEYMAMGKPIVAFSLPEHRYTAEGAALYATPNDEMDFAQKIAFLIDHPRKRTAMGATGRKRIRTDLAWDRQEPFLLQAYAGLPQTNGRVKIRAAAEAGQEPSEASEGTV